MMKETTQLFDTSNDEDLARRLQAEEDAIGRLQPSHQQQQQPSRVVPFPAPQHAGAFPVVTAQPYNPGTPTVVVDLPAAQVSQVYSNPRVIMAFQFSRAVRLISVLDFVICLFWAFVIPPVLFFAPLPLCGWMGPRKYHRKWLVGYLIFVIFALLFRVLLFVFSTNPFSVCVNGFGVLLEIYILNVLHRFMKVIGGLSVYEVDQLRSNQFAPSYGYAWW